MGPQRLDACDGSLQQILTVGEGNAQQVIHRDKSSHAPGLYCRTGRISAKRLEQLSSGQSESALNNQTPSGRRKVVMGSVNHQPWIGIPVRCRPSYSVSIEEVGDVSGQPAKVCSAI